MDYFEASEYLLLEGNSVVEVKSRPIRRKKTIGCLHFPPPRSVLVLLYLKWMMVAVNSEWYLYPFKYVEKNEAAFFRVRMFNIAEITSFSTYSEKV